MTAHTATPWHVGGPNIKHEDGLAIGIVSADGWVVCDVWQDAVPGRENAEFIALACNAYGNLVKELKAARRALKKITRNTNEHDEAREISVAAAKRIAAALTKAGA